MEPLLSEVCRNALPAPRSSCWPARKRFGETGGVTFDPNCPSNWNPETELARMARVPD
jgi:hypothetical protein